MIASDILRADLLDIIFENRNKAYGAYALRKFYDRQVLKSLGVVTILLAIFSALILTSKHSHPFFPAQAVDITPGKVKESVAVATPEVTPAPGKKDKSMSNNIIIVDSLQQADSLQTSDNRVVSMGNVDAGFEPAFQGNGGGVDGPPALTVIPVAPLPPPAPVDIMTPVEKADIDPTFPGGLKALNRFLERNLENPAGVNEGESVSVKVKFVVGFDGELKAFEVKEDGGELFNKEVIRVLKKMPRWIPGKTNGQNVSVYFTIPVKFINGQ